MFAVADIESDFCRAVDKQSEGLLTAEQQEIMRAVERTLFFGMIGVVTVETLVEMSSFVDASDCLSQTVYDIVLCHRA